MHDFVAICVGHIEVADKNHPNANIRPVLVLTNREIPLVGTKHIAEYATSSSHDDIIYENKLMQGSWN